MDIGFGICESNLININKKDLKKLLKLFNTVQIMFSSQNGNIDLLKPFAKQFKNVYIHASYQINIANQLIETPTGLFNIGMEILLDEIENAIKLGAKGIVLHIGKNTRNEDKNVIYNNMIMFIIELFDLMKRKTITFSILLETPAGQSSDMLYDIREFVDFVQIFKNADFYRNLNVCIDTCHIFQAGYDLNDVKGLNDVFETFNPIKNKVKLLHLNDSKNDVGQGLDRHEKIGFGKIKVKNLKKIIEHFNVPIILETVAPYEIQIDNLR